MPLREISGFHNKFLHKQLFCFDHTLQNHPCYQDIFTCMLCYSQPVIPIDSKGNQCKLDIDELGCQHAKFLPIVRRQVLFNSFLRNKPINLYDVLWYLEILCVGQVSFCRSYFRDLEVHIVFAQMHSRFIGMNK